jgi:hypothetical protein
MLSLVDMENNSQRGTHKNSKETQLIAKGTLVQVQHQNMLGQPRGLNTGGFCCAVVYI